MADYKSMKTGALSIIQDAKTYDEKVDISTLMLQLELDATHNLSATVSFYFKKASNTEGSKKRNRQVMAALEQQQPGDILHKGLIAETLVPFVHIGKASHRQASEQDEPCTARAYGIVAHCVLKSIKYLPNAKASGIYTPTSKIAIKLENFELPNEGWSPSWDGRGNMVPCMFGIRVLEKIQMMEPAVMAPLDEEDQEDFESGLEDEMVDEEIREYAAAKETAAAEKAAIEKQERDGVLSQIRKAKNELKALETKQAAMEKERQEMADFDSEGFAHHRSPARDQELKVNIEQIGKQKITAEGTLGKAMHQLNVISKREAGAVVEESIEDEFFTIEMDIELLAVDEPAVVAEPEVETASEEEAVQAAAPQVEPAQEDEVQAAAPQVEQVEEEEAQASPPHAEQAQQPVAPPSPPPVAGKKGSREDTDQPDCDERSKKSKRNLMPPPSQIAGVKRSREGDGPQEVVTKKARTAPPAQEKETETIADAVSPSDIQPSGAAIAGVKRSREDDGPEEVVTKKARTAPPAQEKENIAESVSPLTGQPPSSDIATVASVEKQEAEKSEASSKEKPLSKCKGKANAHQLPTPSESTSPEASAPTAPAAAAPGLPPPPPPPPPSALPALPSSAPRPPPVAASSAPPPPPPTSITPPTPELFTAPINATPSTLDARATNEYHKSNLDLLIVKELRELLKEWGYKPPKGEKSLGKMVKADLVRVVHDAIKSRHKKQVVASQIARRQEAASVAQRAGIAAMKSAYVPGSGGRKPSST